MNTLMFTPCGSTVTCTHFLLTSLPCMRIDPTTAGTNAQQQLTPHAIDPFVAFFVDCFYRMRRDRPVTDGSLNTHVAQRDRP